MRLEKTNEFHGHALHIPISTQKSSFYTHKQRYCESETGVSHGRRIAQRALDTFCLRTGRPIRLPRPLTGGSCLSAGGEGEMERTRRRRLVNPAPIRVRASQAFDGLRSGSSRWSCSAGAWCCLAWSKQTAAGSRKPDPTPHPLRSVFSSVACWVQHASRHVSHKGGMEHRETGPGVGHNSRGRRESRRPRDGTQTRTCVTQQTGDNRAAGVAAPFQANLCRTTREGRWKEMRATDSRATTRRVATQTRRLASAVCICLTCPAGHGPALVQLGFAALQLRSRPRTTAGSYMRRNACGQQTRGAADPWTSVSCIQLAE